MAVDRKKGIREDHRSCELGLDAWRHLSASSILPKVLVSPFNECGSSATLTVLPNTAFLVRDHGDYKMRHVKTPLQLVSGQVLTAREDKPDGI